jgi:hypothetical protein
VIRYPRKRDTVLRRREVISMACGGSGGGKGGKGRAGGGKAAKGGRGKK